MLFKVCFAFLVMVSISMVEGQISLKDLAEKTRCICEKKSDALWEQVIRCHDPMPDSFLRTSGEATCTQPDGSDYSNLPMLQIFKNFCVTTGSGFTGTIKKGKALLCIGVGLPKEKKEVKAKWGDDFPDKIGTCVKAIQC